MQKAVMIHFQLRRIGLSPSVQAVKDVYRLEHDTTVIGRGAAVDIFLDSNIRKGLISRAHAQIIRKKANGQYLYEMFDTSLNGSYVNDYRIKGSKILSEGDVIAFGHLQGSVIEPGVQAPQKETEFLFRFESCKNDVVKSLAVAVDNNNQSTSDLVLPTTLMPEEKLPNEISGKTHSILREINTSDKENTSLQDDLSSLVEKVTSRIINSQESLNDSFTIDDHDGKPSKEPENVNKPTITKPIHPRDKFLMSVQSDCPSSVTSSDNDIKCDTSLNVKHIKKKTLKKAKTQNERLSAKSTNCKNKLKRVLEDHDVGRKVLDDVHTTTDTGTADSETDTKSDVNEASDDSEHSLEVTDSSDSDFVPLSVSPHKKRSTSLRKKSSDDSNIDSESPLKKKKSVYTHDKCAAWDCKKPSGAIKKITWVQCDDCDQWYHLSCSGLNPKEARREDTNFHCGC